MYRRKTLGKKFVPIDEFFIHKSCKAVHRRHDHHLIIANYLLALVASTASNLYDNDAFSRGAIKRYVNSSTLTPSQRAYGIPTSTAANIFYLNERFILTVAFQFPITCRGNSSLLYLLLVFGGILHLVLLRLALYVLAGYFITLFSVA